MPIFLVVSMGFRWKNLDFPGGSMGFSWVHWNENSREVEFMGLLVIVNVGCKPTIIMKPT